MQSDRCSAGVSVCDYKCMFVCAHVRDLELLTPLKRDSAVCGWVEGTVSTLHVQYECCIIQVRTCILVSLSKCFYLYPFANGATRLLVSDT